MTSSTPSYRVLITGVSGLLGRALVSALAARHASWKITGLDLTAPPSTIAEKLEHFFQGDVMNAAQVAAAFSEEHMPDIVVHSAAVVPSRGARYSTDAADWERTKAVNYGGTVNVVSAALSAGCQRFVYTSSVTTIMDDIDHDYFHVAEDAAPEGLAQLHYGRSKLMAEEHIRSQDAAKLKTCILRPCTIFGPEDREVMSVLHDLIAKGETCFVVGDGDNLSDWIYIDNAVQAHILAVENLLSQAATAAGHTIYITNQEPVYFWDFLTFIWAQFEHYPAFRIYIPPYLAFIVAYILELITCFTRQPATLTTGSVKDGMRTFFVNNDKAIELLNYTPHISLAEGVRRACEGYKLHLAKIERLR